jgi:hypothetical protein
MKRIQQFVLLTALAGSLIACKKNDPPVEVTVPGPDLVVFGLSANNELIEFNAKTPQVFISKKAITNIGAAEKLLSIDYRPATGELYALSNASKLYIINTTNVAARVVNATAFTPAITGSVVSIDFNPTVDRLRLVTNSGQNLRLNPETGAVVATDGNINGVTNASVSGIAYTNSKADAATTILYDVDATTAKLYKQDPPNNGTLSEVGSMGVSFAGQIAFDISGDNTAALIAAQNGTANTLYLLNITTGAATKIGMLPEAVLDIAIPTEMVAYAVDNSNNLLLFNPQNPMPVSKTITGLQAGEAVLGIDFRPLNGQLYALGSSNRLYTLNLASGAATAVGTTAFTTALSGTDFGFDFNPTVDRIRVVSNSGQNLRLNPIDGTVAAVDAVLNPGTPVVSAAAYTNNFAGATTTALLVIDAATDMVYLQNPPNNGVLTALGSLGVDISGTNGFDIGSNSNKAYLVATVAGTTKIFSVNSTTGATTAVSNLPVSVKAFAVGTGF